MFTIKDDPLTRAVSLFGRISANKVPIGSSLRRSARRSFEEIKRTNSTVEGAMPGLDILRGVYTLTQISHVTIDSLIFRLHSNATVILLVTFSIAVTTRQYVGNPIDCVHTKDIPEDVLNTYCWIHSTYTMMEAFLKRPGYQVPYPGVENSFQKAPGKNQIKQVKYYQWVAFMLFFQKHCNKEPSCVKCIGRYLAKDCTRPKDSKLKCVRCGEAHPASCGGCKKL